MEPTQQSIELARELRGEVYARGKNSAVSLLFALFFVVLMSFDFFRESSAGQRWAAAIIITSVARYFFSALSAKRPLTETESQIHDLNILLGGYSWGHIAIVSFQERGLLSLSTVTLLVIAAGAAAGATASISPLKKLYLSYLVVMLAVPGINILINEENFSHRLFGFLVAVFGAFLYQQSEFYRKNLENKFKMASLANREKEHLQEIVHYQQESEKQKERMMSTSKLASLGEMATGLAHEINNPLCVLLMRLQQLESLVQSSPHPDEKMQANLVILRRNGERIGKIVASMMACSRQQDDEPLRPTSLSQVLGDVEALCAFKLQSLGIRFEITGLKPSTHLMTRSAELSQVFLNLITNSMEALESLSEKWIRIDVSDQRGKVLIRIVDSGKGIPPGDQAKIWEPFFTTKPTGSGTGMGLATCFGMIKGQGGVISYDSQAQNTTFMIELIQAEAPSAVAAA